MILLDGFTIDEWRLILRGSKIMLVCYDFDSLRKYTEILVQWIHYVQLGGKSLAFIRAYVATGGES